jgi:hypothetical protein
MKKNQEERKVEVKEFLSNFLKKCNFRECGLHINKSTKKFKQVKRVF